MGRCDQPYFRSKVGGKPAWLSLSPIPKANEVACPKCRKITQFLLQVYAPFENQQEAFHRAIFIFVCVDPGCCKYNRNENFIVFRSQLPRDNEFYSCEPPSDNDKNDGPSASQFQDLCIVCGITGPKRCSQCHKATYCSKEHQTIDWKTNHKKSCKGDFVPSETKHKEVLFPEFEIVTETEELEDEQEEPNDAEKLKDYKAFMKTDASKSLMKDEANADLEKMATSETEDDKIFFKFKKRIQHEPEQVLRYQLGGDPLFVSSIGIPSTDDIPKCSCAAPRQFEFQVMPQLLSHLDVDRLDDSLDWGTLCVYTCSKNCSISNNYHPEFLWKQDYASNK